jgi:cytochrome c biogenesis factor
MEIKIGATLILRVLQILSWIIFIGVCADAGGIIFNTVYALYKPIAAKYAWNGMDLSALYSYDKGQFITQMTLVSIAAVLKALIFYMILKLFHDKKFSFSKPFNMEITGVIFKIAYCCLGAGIFSFWGVKYAAWLKSLGITMPETETMRIGGADVWIFMAVTLLVIGQVFKKGTELQSENDLTV